MCIRDRCWVCLGDSDYTETVQCFSLRKDIPISSFHLSINGNYSPILSLVLCLAYFKNFILYSTPSYLKPFSGSQVTHRIMSKCLSLPLSRARMMCPELVYPASSRTAIFRPPQATSLSSYDILQMFHIIYDICCLLYTSDAADE